MRRRTYLTPIVFACLAISASAQARETCHAENDGCTSASCEAPNKRSSTDRTNDSIEEVAASQIGQYVTSAFEDSKGRLWFGTLSEGIARYDGHRLKYLTTKDGLPSNRVTGLIEDSNGIFWLKTGGGLSRYDGDDFTNYSIGDDPSRNVVANLLIDSRGVFWIGTWAGAYKFDGKEFHPFPIPYPEIDTDINEDTRHWVAGIKEGPSGDIWFERDGYGVCRYDGNSFTHFLKKDGLHSNRVTEIAFDKDGSIWVGTRVAERDNADPSERAGRGGVNRMSGGEIVSFPGIEGFNDGDVYNIYRDPADNIWISTARSGVYRFDGKEFKHYDVPVSIMGMLRDRRGNLWLGGAGGLYRINHSGDVENITTDGPWE